MSRRASGRNEKAPMSDADDVPMTMLNRGAWLVKVPRYLSDEWRKRRGQEVGEVAPDESTIRFVSTIKQGDTMPRVSSSSAIRQGQTSMGPPPTRATPTGSVTRLVSNMSVTEQSAPAATTPTEHEMRLTDTGNVMLMIAKEDRSRRLNRNVGGRVAVTARVSKRVDLRPRMNEKYLEMKVAAMKASNQPKRQVQRIDRIEVNLRNTQAYRQATRPKTKEEREMSKAVRADRSTVMDKLFEAFQAHEFYRLADLQVLTRRPPSYLKEILNDIAIYHTRPPHRAMWQLKEEYRAYQHSAPANS